MILFSSWYLFFGIVLYFYVILAAYQWQFSPLLLT